MKMLQEFKNFAVKGNMVDMAIGIIIGAAFKDVIDVLVKKVMLPPLTMLTDGINFSDRKWVLRKSELGIDGQEMTEVAVSYGELFEVGIDFLIISFVVFLVVKAMNKLRNKGEDHKDKTVETPKDIELLAKMNELLEEQNALLRADRPQ
ncbi:large conductance mechanosensitive channel protein MscL [Croceiramulus getboli]|nr:large conductance mechanosensitive channel protein MscL [Flavobacteriaceae bacterium YJPT1-3]